MTDENIEFVDREYGQLPRIKPSRQIKTRKLSFENIRNAFRKFHLRLLQGKLDKAVEKSLTQQYSESNADKDVTKNAAVIARLEGKIKVLSKEKVPTNYVARRAIKLRKAMMENLSTNVEGYRTIGIEKRDEIMATDQVVEEPVVTETEDTLKASAIPSGNSDDIDIVSPELDRNSIVDAVNSSFEEVEKKEEATEKEPLHVEPIIIDREEVRAAVDEAFSKLDSATASTEPPVVNMESVNEDVDRMIETIHVSRNNARSVDSTRFDENGNRIRRKKYDYTPMTNDEIRESQIKLGFDEHGNLIEKKPEAKTGISLKEIFPSKEDKPVRDNPVVVEDRTASAPGLDLEDGVSMFEIIETEEPTKETSTDSVIHTAATIDDYTALKERVIQLQKQRSESYQSKLAAQKKAEEAAARAQDARKQLEMTQASYNERMQRLREYAASLEADYQDNVRMTEDAERKSKASEEFVAAQNSEVDKTKQIIGEIDSMIGEIAPSEESTAIRVIK